ncbi:MAG: 30S ribosomal protein S12 methylthiotransferase RimO [Marinilabiliales bacterium]|nr:MAG: 30S ribosomal protein S12 methylthiotransferase RimO [Marinilabiliales bacterium]
MKKINVITLGCSKNLIDSEVMMRQLQSDYAIMHDSDETSDIVIINTCGFINDAKEESIDTILRSVEAKKAGDIQKIYVTGCLSERYKKDLQNEIKNVDGFYGVNELPEVLNALEVDYKNELVGERLLTTPKHYAYLKISEGCDRTCSFCAIPLIRGKHKSKTIEEIIKETEFLASKGVKEVMLIAQDLTYYGIDIYRKRKIAELVQKISEVDGIEWIRLHYAYPAGFPEDLLDVMKNNPKVCNYLDIPLQHISDTMLKSMKRALGKEGTVKLVQKIREQLPDAVIRTTLIVGYPGETEDDFQQLMDFVRDSKFERLGVFQYSPEEGTTAFPLKDDVPAKVKQDRADQLMMLQQEISFELNQAKVGKVFKTIIDKKEGDFYIGRTEFDSPEVDQEVLISAANNDLTIGNFYHIQIYKAEFYDVYGEVI